MVHADNPGIGLSVSLSNTRKVALLEHEQVHSSLVSSNLINNLCVMRECNNSGVHVETSGTRHAVFLVGCTAVDVVDRAWTTSYRVGT